MFLWSYSGIISTFINYKSFIKRLQWRRKRSSKYSIHKYSSLDQVQVVQFSKKKIASTNFFQISFQHNHKLVKRRISEINLPTLYWAMQFKSKQQKAIIQNRSSKKVEATGLGWNMGQTKKTYWDRRTVSKLRYEIFDRILLFGLNTIQTAMQ